MIHAIFNVEIYSAIQIYIITLMSEFIKLSVCPNPENVIEKWI